MFNRLFRRKPKPPLEEALRLAQGSEAMYRKALEHNEALGNKEGMADAYNNLGVFYSIRDELHKAEAMYRKALELYEELGSKDAMAIVCNNLGVVYKTRGDLEQAEAMFRKAKELNKAMGRKAP